MKVLVIMVVMLFALSFFSFPGGAFADEGIMENEDTLEEILDTDDGQIEPVDELAMEEFEQDEEYENEDALDYEKDDTPETEDEDHIDERY